MNALMLRFSRTSVLSLAALVLLVGMPQTGAGLPPPPDTRTDNVTETVHGVEITDPYRWLEDQDSPETRAWIDAQNEYTRSILGAVGGRGGRDDIKSELTPFIRYDWYGTPTKGGDYFFFMRELADENLKSICVRKGLHGGDDVLIDPRDLSDDQSVNAKILTVSRDGSVMAYGIRKGGEDEVTVRFYDMATRSDLDDELPRGRYGEICFEPGNRSMFYSKHLDEGPRIYHHVSGKDPSEDEEIFGSEYGPGEGVSVDLSDDGRFLLLTVWHGSAARKTDIYCRDLEGEGEIEPIVNDIEARFYGLIGGHDLHMLTNWNAPNGRVIRVNLENPSRDEWEEIIPETEAVLKDHSLAGGKVFARYLDKVVSSVKIFEPSGAPAGEIGFEPLGNVSKVTGRWDEDTAFVSFNSVHIPSTVYHYSVGEGTRGIWFEVDVPFDSGLYETRLVWYDSKDGTEVPMFLAYRKDLELDGNRPVLLTGYGGFTHTISPKFSATKAVWMAHRGVYANPGLRGGGELGEEWHEAGMLDNKQNTFDDFIAAAEWLIESGYTRPDKISIWGGSNGGLLVGAALTQRPELFGAVICTYPLLDMLRYHKFLVAAWWVPEYGSADDPEQFEYIYHYSPYHRVRFGAEYPAVLFVTGDADTRVAPLHARKMAALLQAANASERPVLLQYDTRAGHSGGKPTQKYIEDLTDRMLFLFWQLGMPITTVLIDDMRKVKPVDPE